MVRRTEAYVDTSALIAFADVSDTHSALFRRLFSKPPALLTTSLVVSEGHAWFLKRYDRTRALQFLAMIEDMKFLRVTTVGRTELKAAGALLRKYRDQGLTMVDAVGLHMLKEHGCRTCWSTDFHLGLTGVRLAIHEH